MKINLDDIEERIRKTLPRDWTSIRADKLASLVRVVRAALAADTMLVHLSLDGVLPNEWRAALEAFR